jgi:hypothetical protein
VPEDVSVIGAGGEESPGLTCHQVEWYQMGRTAVQVLLRALADPGRPAVEHHLSPHTLRVGRTTAAPGGTPKQTATARHGRPPGRRNRGRGPTPEGF